MSKNTEDTHKKVVQLQADLVEAVRSSGLKINHATRIMKIVASGLRGASFCVADPLEVVNYFMENPRDWTAIEKLDS